MYLYSIHYRLSARRYVYWLLICCTIVGLLCQQIQLLGIRFAHVACILHVSSRCINSLGPIDALIHPGLLAGSSYCNRIKRSFLKHDDLHGGVMTRTSRHEAYNGMPSSFCSFFHTWILAACVQVELSTFQCSESISLTSNQTIVVPPSMPKRVSMQKCGDEPDTLQARTIWAESTRRSAWLQHRTSRS